VYGLLGSEAAQLGESPSFARHLQGQIVCQARSASAGLLLGSTFNFEKGGDMFLRNIGLSP
jgi:hypothetical protein